ncbi:plasmid mobilization protein [Kitasatospora kifunensis]|uniref:Bacterial mobilisation domain-containing protein n=1 Tax=Kitasatospora kifunensis TaxID=58351 RepID=A0A7W7VW58_KITKI|nr:hypothetical protein [Kitasatospora kifunensis]MBB4924583.1 hypothetical protein [Kitasatospora kifunensis]
MTTVRQPMNDQPENPVSPLHRNGDDHRSAPDGASKGVRPSYEGSDADALAREGEGEPVMPSAGAHSASPDVRRQGAPHEEKPSTAPPANVQPLAVSATAAVPSAESDPDVPPTRPAAARRPKRATAHRAPKRRRRNNTNPLDDQLTFRCHSEDKAEIERRAKAAELATAVYVIRKALADDHTDIATRDERLDAAIDEVAALRTQIAKLGNNVNQLTRDYHSDIALPPGQVLEAFTQGRSLLADARTLLTDLDEVAMRLAKGRNR